MSKIKKIAYCAVTLVLIVSLLSVTYLSADAVKPTQSWTGEQIREQAQLVGYTYEYNSELEMDAYRSHLSSSYILLPHDGSDFNTVVVKLKNDIYALPEQDEENGKLTEEENEDEELFADPRLYYSIDEDGRFLSQDYCTPTEIVGANTLVFRSYHVESKNLMALNIDTSFDIEEITVYNIEGSAVTMQYSLPAVITFAAILLILLIIEPKFGYYRAIKQKICDEAAYTRELKSGKRGALLLHLGAIIFTAALVVFVAAMIILNRYTSTAIIVAFFLSVAAVGLTLADRISSGRDCTPAKLFLIVAVLVGIMMCYTAPPATATTWDDETHFKHSYNVATLYNGEDSFSLYKLYHLYGWGDFPSDPTHFTNILVAESAVDIEFPTDRVNAYTAISYAPMASVLALLSLFGADLVKMLVLCRFATLITFAYICYRGIRKLQGGALVFSSVCLLPGILFFGCSISYDAWIIAWFVYAFASIFAVYQTPDRKFTTAELVKILLAFFVACSPKSPYCVMMLALLFINKNKFSSPKAAKTFKICTVLTVVVILAILILPGLFVYDMYSDPRGGSNVNSAGQIMNILSNPFGFAVILVKHLFRYISLLIFSDHGVAYGYLHDSSGGDPHIFTIAMIIIVFCIFVDRKRKDLFNDNKLLQPAIAVSALATIVLIATAMYVAFTDVGSSIINGCQYRYAFPLLAPLLFCMRPKRIYSELPQSNVLAFAYGGLAFNALFGYLWIYIHLFFL